MATTPYPFVASTVLTALQLNSTFNIPTTTKTASHTFIAADAGTRVIMNSASATSFTVDASVFGAGDIVEIQNIGAGVCTVTAGTATVVSAGPLAIPQNGGGRLVFSSASAATYFPTAVTASPGGLTLVSATTIGTTVASVTVTGAFSATFDAYKIIISGGLASGADAISLQLGAATTQYRRSESQAAYTGAITANTDNSTASFRRVGMCSTTQLMMFCDLINPFLANKTNLIYTRVDSVFAAPGGGVQDQNTSFTAFTIFAEGASTFTGGTIAVYGYAK